MHELRAGPVQGLQPEWIPVRLWMQCMDCPALFGRFAGRVGRILVCLNPGKACSSHGCIWMGCTENLDMASGDALDFYIPILGFIARLELTCVHRVVIS
jgi:hypothetical protein